MPTTRRTRSRAVLGASLTGFLAFAARAPARGQDPSDAAAINRIKQEGFQRSQVMEIMSWLTDVHGPRLTGSPITRGAGEWAVKTMKDWGLQNVGFEWWGPFGRGWVNERFHAQVLSPVPFPVIGYPNAWTESTRGSVTGEVMILHQANLVTSDSLTRWWGKLRGKILLVLPVPNVPPWFQPLAHRFTDAELAQLAAAPAPPPGQPFRPSRPPEPAPGNPADPHRILTPAERQRFFVSQGVLALLMPGRGSGGTVFPWPGGSRSANPPPSVPQVSIAVEHYGRIYRIVEKKIPVRMELNVQNRFYRANPNSFNVVGEIPGSDQSGQLVMVGAHLDSWHSGTGATDNAAGSAVMLEAMRILKASGVKLRRTVRIGLWTGEEQGLLGSREYVKKHFGDRSTMRLTPEHAKLSAYYNVDNGTGAIRGVYLQGNAQVAPIFSAWMKLLDSDSITVRTLTLANTGGTDHLAFDAVGLPGFQFIQDPVEYDTRTHHSNMDVYERIQPVDLRHNAVVVATFVYLTANRQGLLPRKPPEKAGESGMGNRERGAAPIPHSPIPTPYFFNRLNVPDPTWPPP